MTTTRLLAALLITLLPATWATAQKPADELLGQWYTEDDASKVVIVKRNGKYYGTIIWLDEPLYPKDDKEAGKVKYDRENREKKLRKRPIIGIEVLKS